MQILANQSTEKLRLLVGAFFVIRVQPRAATLCTKTDNTTSTTLLTTTTVQVLPPGVQAPAYGVRRATLVIVSAYLLAYLWIPRSIFRRLRFSLPPMPA